MPGRAQRGALHRSRAGGRQSGRASIHRGRSSEAELSADRWGGDAGVLCEGAGRGGAQRRASPVYAREDRGGYGYMVRQGFTTLPESWDAKPGTGNSMNHFMLGHLMEWHFAYVAGIRQQPGGVGWRRVLIAPNPGPLTSAEASFNSPAGRVGVKWVREGDRFTLTATVPEGIEAVALLPGGERQALKSGATTLHSTIH